jgi:dihydrofolate reductase
MGRRLVVSSFVSLDGVMEAPGGEPGHPHSGWVGPLFSDELGEFKYAEQMEADVLLLGRVTYESFHGAWPHREGPFAEKINTMRKVVASRTLGSSDWANTTVVGDDLEGAVRALKDEDGGPILVAGSCSVVHQLLAAGLVDQLNVQVFPLLLGTGIRLYPHGEDAHAFTLAPREQRVLANGITLQTFDVGPADVVATMAVED